MPYNSVPIYVRRPAIYSNTVIGSNTTKDLSTGTVTEPIFRSNTENGSYLDTIRVKSLGTCVQTVARIFFNDGGPTTVANNNSMISELTLPATTKSEAVWTTDIVLPMKMALPPSANIYVTLGTAVADGWAFTGIGGDY